MARLRTSRLPFLILAALGVVYGDIGTSPLYALRECFTGPHAIDVSRANVLGVLSLIAWSLVIVVSVKYLLFVMRADNAGEGGILALVALVRARAGRAGRVGLIAFGLFGAALLYGDGMITPAISVLSAVSTIGLRAIAGKPSRASTTNQPIMIGPKIVPMPLVPRLWTTKSTIRMTTVIGTT